MKRFAALVIAAFAIRGEAGQTPLADRFTLAVPDVHRRGSGRRLKQTFEVGVTSVSR